MAFKYLLRRLCRHLGKDRPATGQPHAGRPRQVENVITIQKKPEHFRAADDANAGVWRPQRGQGLFERRAAWIPEQRLFMQRVGRDGRYVPSQNQPAAQMRMRLSLMRVAPTNHHIDPVEPEFEKLLVGLELELVRHDTCRVLKHAVLGDNGVTFDATWTGHAILFRQITLPRHRRLSNYETFTAV